jgi:hypothetical protein
MYVIGIDPGPVPGIVRLLLLRTDTTALLDAQALQVTRGVLPEALSGLSRRSHHAVALERFVVGRRAGRSTTPEAGIATRNMIGEVVAWARDRCPVHLRSASEVKPWATDARLEAAGLLELTKGMRHARDAARHALFCAVRDYGLPDPLSSSWRAA